MFGAPQERLTIAMIRFVIGAGCGGERATFALTKSEELAEVVPIQQGTVLDPSARTVEIVPLQGIIPDDAMIYILKVDVQGLVMCPSRQARWARSMTHWQATRRPCSTAAVGGRSSIASVRWRWSSGPRASTGRVNHARPPPPPCNRFDVAPPLCSRGSDPVAVLERIYAEYGMTCYDMGFHEKYIPANRDGEIGAYVRFLLGIPRSLDILGGWEDLVCM